MDTQRIVITGGAGFVGSNLATSLRARLPQSHVVAFDNLRRRGSELTLPRLRAAGVEFVHGDVRAPEDVARLPSFDLMIDCSAEPSVHAGATGSPREVLGINLLGTINCLEAARTRGARILFLSTSRVYPVEKLNALAFEEGDSRFHWKREAYGPGLGPGGVAEDFPLEGVRSFYGASKLCSELLIQEYCAQCGVPALIDRCGVLAGPWQMGKVDQGVASLWVAAHHFGKPLQYIGFGGAGKQVRDILHVDDLFELVVRQLAHPEVWDGRVYNIGGGEGCSVSLLELTQLCREATGREVEIGARPETNPLDVRIYLSDCWKAERDFQWRPRHTPKSIVSDIARWVAEQEDALREVMA
jgi:CDP-paratose 2-epimerase